MSNHLPECRRWFTEMPVADECPACEMFRACEKRVLAEQLAGYDMAYYAGVQAARDAVKNAPWLTMCIGTEANPGVEEPWVRATDALNAIDALGDENGES